MEEDKHQKIECSVHSCQYNKGQEDECSLQKIMVAPIDDCDTCEPDESMCASYEYNGEESADPEDWEAE